MNIQRNTIGIKITGWAWVIFGALSVVSGIGSLLLLIASQQSQPADVAHNASFMTLMHGIQMLFSVVGTAAGIGLLCGKSWARRILEVWCGIVLLYAIGFGLYSVAKAWAIMAGRAPGMMAVIIVLLMIGAIAISSAPFVAMLIVLRRHGRTGVP